MKVAKIDVQNYNQSVDLAYDRLEWRNIIYVQKTPKACQGFFHQENI